MLRLFLLEKARVEKKMEIKDINLFDCRHFLLPSPLLLICFIGCNLKQCLKHVGFLISLQF